MRLGSKRRIYIRSNWVNQKRISIFLFLSLIVAIGIAGLLYFLRIVHPLLFAQAENKTKILAEQAVHQSIRSIFQNKDYTNFMTLSTLEDGTISAATADMAEVNRLKAEVALEIQQQIDALDGTVISIPLGSVIGLPFLSGLGPELPVALKPYGHVLVDFSSKFTEAGINQTHLEISLMATCYMDFVLPGRRVAAEIKTEMPVVQTIIVGEIPDNYVNIDRMGEDYEDDVLDIIG
ncbi:MAG: sporulation protein YunB [Ruminococcaceae bacterium]|nr:sporulation protein YunB [Oscillospiraceae bacterium]